jgi:hypothetical protein
MGGAISSRKGAQRNDLYLVGNSASLHVTEKEKQADPRAAFQESMHALKKDVKDSNGVGDLPEYSATEDTEALAMQDSPKKKKKKKKAPPTSKNPQSQPKSQPPQGEFSDLFDVKVG